METDQNQKTLELDYNRWRCGGGYLLDGVKPKGCLPPGKKAKLWETLLRNGNGAHNSCCLGLILLESGAPPEALKDKTVPGRVDITELHTDEAVAMLKKLMDTGYRDCHGQYRDWVEEAMRINDANVGSQNWKDGETTAHVLGHLSDEASDAEIIGRRITLLEKIFAEQKIPARFINIPEDVARFVHSPA